MQDIGRAGNVILYIPNIHEITGVSAGEKEGSLDVAGTLNDYLGSGRFLTLATTEPDNYSRHIVSSPIGTLFAKVEIQEMSEDQAIQVLESKVGTAEYRQHVFFCMMRFPKLCNYLLDFYMKFVCRVALWKL